MSARAAARGQPLLVFAMILGAWLVARVLMWEVPFPTLAQSPAPGLLDRTARQVTVALPAMQAAPESRAPGKAMEAAAGARSGPPAFAASPVPSYPATVVEGPIEPRWRAMSEAQIPAARLALAPPRRAAGHHLLLAAAFAHLELPPEVARFYGRDGDRLVQAPPPARLAAVDRPLLGTGPAGNEPVGKRWSGDSWLLWRDGSAAAAAPGITAYGRSQAGAVLRYRLAASPARPTVYARMASALQRPGQAEAAAGLALRPLRGVPVSVAAEARVTDTDSGRRAGSAVFAVTELPPAALPFGLRGEAYVQAGYVSGRYETAFVDGQVRADRRIVRIGQRDDELRAGLAAWGGAQEGAARLDVGPSATMGFRLGETHSRLAVDYRVRVAGEAAPASGPAVTFSAGF